MNFDFQEIDPHDFNPVCILGWLVDKIDESELLSLFNSSYLYPIWGTYSYSHPQLIVGVSVEGEDLAECTKVIKNIKLHLDLKTSPKFYIVEKVYDK